MRVSETLLALVLAAAAMGADPPAPGADSIADAKKDLATIKAAAGQEEPGSSLPTLDMKDITPGPGAGTLGVAPLLAPDKDPSLDPAKKKQGTGNWLVDAMDKSSDRKNSSKAKDKDDVLKGDLDLLRGDERAGAPADKDAESLDEAREKASAREAAETAYNPLDSFMAGWVSARDHDLLLPSSKGDALALAGADRGRSDTLPGLDLGQGGSPADSLLTPAEGAAFGDPRADSNPYLAVLDLAPAQPMRSFQTPELAGFSPFALPETLNGVSAMGDGARPSDASRTFVPDFAQPPDDDKYFKQMKRF
jgi:hypothetical protein